MRGPGLSLSLRLPQRPVMKPGCHRLRLNDAFCSVIYGRDILVKAAQHGSEFV